MWNNCERIYPCCTLVFLFETRNDIKERQRVREREKEGVRREREKEKEGDVSGILGFMAL